MHIPGTLEHCEICIGILYWETSDTGSKAPIDTASNSDKQGYQNQTGH